MPQSLAGKVAVVTGAARGIGRSVALELASRGADIAIVDISHDDAAADLVSAIEEMGRGAIAIPADVSSTAQVQATTEDVVGAFGRLDILVNNAAVSTRQPFLQTPLDHAERTMQVSQWGTYLCSYFAARQMVRQGNGGNIVMISSVHAERPYPNAAAYNMSKAGVNHLAASLALELAPERIRVNTIEPGWIYTPGERVHNSEQEIAERGRTLPMHRLGSPEEIARAVAFLCSDDASYITGANLRVDGGFALKF